MQPTQVGLGTSATDSSTLKLDYNYGVLVNGTLDATRNSGDVQSQTITAGGLTLQQSYEYDELNRLKSAQEAGGASQVWQQVYKYDRFGNRTLDAGTTKPVLPQSQSLEEATLNPAVSTSTNRVTSSGYIFDPAGNMTSAPGYAYTYDGEGRMATADTGQPLGSSAYSYDGDGKRVKKVVGAGSGTTVFVYDAAGKLVAEYSNAAQQTNGTQYLTSDTLGSPRVITGADRAVKSRHDFRPFGEEVAATEGGRSSVPGYGGGDNLRQKFTGYEHDAEAGLDFAQARYYANPSGRFTSVDPLLASAKLGNPQTWNRYSYTSNDPINSTDPTGKDWLRWVENGQDQVYQWLTGNAAEAARAAGWKDVVFGNDGEFRYQATYPTNGLLGEHSLIKGGGHYWSAIPYSEEEQYELYRQEKMHEEFVQTAGVLAALPFFNAFIEGVGSESVITSTSSSSNEATDAALFEANVAQQSAVRPGAAGALQTRRGNLYTGTSGRTSGVNPAVQEVLDNTPQSMRSSFHGKCCEVRLLSDALDSGENPSGGTISILRVRPIGNPNHGTFLFPCPSCQRLVDSFKLKVNQ